MIRHAWRRLTLAFAALCVAPAAHAICGPDPDGMCEIEGGSYHLALPDTPTDGAPALIFLHGWGSSGQGTMSMSGVVNAALSRGYAFIAPNGVPRQGRNGLTWGFYPDRPGPRDEVAFLQAVSADAADRFGLDASSMLLSGFSIGGSMVSYLACAAPDSFAAYAPVAGAFWRPHPADCAGPVRLFHTHGWTDGTVPLEGRIFQDEITDPTTPGLFAQGDVWQSMEIWRLTNGCRPNAQSYEDTGTYWRRSWTDCTAGALDFALHYGGHGIPRGWTDMALDWFEAGPTSN